MELNAHTRSVNDIFSIDKKYSVPRFQREYSWQNEEVEEFWEDIKDQIKQNSKKIKFEEYFIGCIVLVGDDTKAEYMIVDGQQRLTTLTILLRAIVERMRELEEPDAATALYRNVIEGTDNDGKKYFKLVNQSPKPYFQNEIQALEPAKIKKAETDEEKLLYGAYSFFIKKLKDLEIGDLVGIEAVKALRDQVLNYLKFILVTAKDEDDAYTIFETLNARGLGLTSVDLIKNWIFKNYNQTHPHDNAKDIWEQIRASVSKFSDLETFFRHYWNSKYAFSSDDRLYKSFKDFQKRGMIGNAKDFLLELQHAALNYRKIGAPSEHDWKIQKERPVKRAFELLNQYRVTQVRPFLLALLECRENKTVDQTTFVKTIISLESFHFVFSNICQARASGLEGKYTRAAKNLRNAKTKQKAKEVIADLIVSLEEKRPKIQRIADAVNALSFTSDDDSNKKVFQTIFSKVEAHLLETSELQIAAFSLEHVADQSHGHAWVGQLGNLLPLDENINNKIKEGTTFKQKKVHYQKSKFSVVQRFLDANVQDNWDKNSVLKWQKDLVNLLDAATAFTH